jgi:K+-transporting ATPase A subunit
MRRHSDGCSGVFAYCQLFSGAVRSGKATGNGLARMINNVPAGTGSVEKGIWRVLGIDDREMNWRQYLMAILLLNIVGLIALLPC